MQTITRDELKHWIEAHKDFVLVEALKPEEYHKGHLPGALNIPVNDKRFAAMILKAEPNKQNPVVVYCANTECPASTKLAQKLEAEGYQQVYDYEDGKADWEENGLPIVH